MQSSAISLLHKAIHSFTEDSYLINLIDSPGVSHVIWIAISKQEIYTVYSIAR